MYHNGLPSLGTNFPLFSFNRNFSNLKLHNTITKLTWAKFHTKFMRVHVHLDSGNGQDACLICKLVQHSWSICNSSAQRIIVSCGANPLLHRAFIACSQYKHPSTWVTSSLCGQTLSLDVHRRHVSRKKIWPCETKLFWY